jgi:hypothetical protein
VPAVLYQTPGCVAVPPHAFAISPTPDKVALTVDPESVWPQIKGVALQIKSLDGCDVIVT